MLGAGTGASFRRPAVVNGRVYQATPSGLQTYVLDGQAAAAVPAAPD